MWAAEPLAARAPALLIAVVRADALLLARRARAHGVLPPFQAPVHRRRALAGAVLELVRRVQAQPQRDPARRQVRLAPVAADRAARVAAARVAGRVVRRVAVAPVGVVLAALRTADRRCRRWR